MRRLVAPVLAVAVSMTLTRLLLAASGGAGAFTNPLAYATLTRYGTAPVLPLGSPGAWDDAMIAGQSAFYDAASGRWVMVYSGSADGSTFDTGLAYSRNLLDWTKEAANPVFTANATEGSQVAQVIIPVAGGYRMYYQSYGGSDGGSRIYGATSSDMLTWTRANGGVAILTPGSAGAWDSEFVFDPSPQLYGSTTYLYYGGQKDTAGTKTRGIGYATASDGFTFTKYGSNPILTPSGGESHINLGAPSIVGDATDFDIWYDSSTTPDHRYINHARTSDGGATWDTVDHDWFGPGSGWDSGQVFDAAAIVHAGVLYLFYGGSTVAGGGVGLSSEIGLATMRWP